MNITDDKITEFINSYYVPLDDDMRALREKNEADNVPLILRETESFLRFLLSALKPSRILEIGTAYGYSALFFARYLPDCTVTTIDRSGRMIEAARANFAERPEGERIDFRIGDAGEVLDEMIEDESSKLYDFVFIDAGKSHYREFFDRAVRLCRPGSVIVCDNILMRGWLVDRSLEGAYRHRTNVKYMRMFIDYISSRDDLTVSLLSSGDGLAVIRLGEIKESDG
jgi:predicted O-methyltransferase YrrM